MNAANRFILGAYPTIRKKRIRLKGIISSWSMVPLLKPKMIIMFSPVGPEELKTGDIVCFYNKRFIAHRLICKRSGALILKGDNKSRSDKPVPTDQIIGKATQIIVSSDKIINLNTVRSRIVTTVFTLHSLLINKFPFLLHIIKGRGLLLKIMYGREYY